MTKNIQSLGAVALLALATAVPMQPAAFGQATVTETTTSDGTVSEFSPDSIVIRSQSVAEPVHYSYTKSTTVVDEAGNPVDVSVVKTGVPVQVYYEGTGEHMIARRIVVRRAAPAAIEKRETTTTTTETH